MARILLHSAPGGARRPPRKVVGAWETMVVLKHVLVATDFGEPAGVALDYGRELARVFGATLHVVHVVDDINARALGLTGFPEHMPVLAGVQQDLQAAARDTLAKLITEDDRRRLSVRTDVLTGPTPAAAILEYAKDALIDLIIVGTHSRGAVAQFFMGSVADRLVRAAPCPVLTVRQPEREFLRPDALEAAARH